MLEGLSAFFASLGFAILFNIRKRKLLIAGIVGAVGGVTYHLLLKFGHSTFLALFVASVIISLLSEVCARYFKAPATTFLVCALIPLVPGGGMYYTMLEIVRSNIDGALIMGMNTIMQAAAIVLGVTLISSSIKMYYKFLIWYYYHDYKGESENEY